MTLPESAAPRRLLLAGALLGIGMGGFVDGIVFGQILQVHGMRSARRPPATLADMQINMVWDGLFQAAAWAVTLAGLIVLFQAGRGLHRFWSGRALAGAMLLGWGAFNLAEGVINHHPLHTRHVVGPLGESWFDWAFLASGVLLSAWGGSMVHASIPRRQRRQRRHDEREVAAACALMAG